MLDDVSNFEPEEPFYSEDETDYRAESPNINSLQTETQTESKMPIRANNYQCFNINVEKTGKLFNFKDCLQNFKIFKTKY